MTEHDIRFNEKFAAKIGANVGYNKELMNVDDWRDKFTILDVGKRVMLDLLKNIVLE